MMIYENMAGVLSLDGEGAFLRIDWRQGFRDDADIIAVFEKASSTSHELKCYKLLVNQQVMLSPSPVAEAWFIYEWLPKLTALIPSGRCAVVVGDNFVTRSTTSGYLGQVAAEIRQYQVQQFLFEQEAIDWLLSAE